MGSCTLIPETATDAVGTHLIGMHSCFRFCSPFCLGVNLPLYSAKNDGSDSAVGEVRS